MSEQTEEPVALRSRSVIPLASAEWYERQSSPHVAGRWRRSPGSQNLEALLVLATGQERRAKAPGQAIKERFPVVDVAEWLERNPYQDRDLVERWKKSLATAGTIDG